MPHRKIVLSVGSFIFITGLLIIISLVYVINKKGVFEAHKKYQLIAKDAENIEKGMAVLFSGFEIGNVSDLGLHDNGEVLVTVSIPEHNTKWVRVGSVFALENPLIGKAKITLNSNMKSPVLTGQVVLRMHIKDGINEIISNIQPVILELQSIVTNIDILSKSLADSNASFQTSLTNAESFSTKLAHSPSILGSVTGDKNSAEELHQAISNLNLALTDIRGIVKNANGGVSELREEIIKPAATNMKEIELILKDVHEKLRIMDKAVKTLGNSDKDIKYFKDEMKVLLDEMNEISTQINSMIGKESTEDVQLP